MLLDMYWVEGRQKGRDRDGRSEGRRGGMISKVRGDRKDMLDVEKKD